MINRILYSHAFFEMEIELFYDFRFFDACTGISTKYSFDLIFNRNNTNMNKFIRFVSFQIALKDDNDDDN